MYIEQDSLTKLSVMSNKWLSDLYNKENKRIFHYTSQDVLLLILNNETLRFSDRFYLNDKTEGAYRMNLMIERMNEIIPDKSRLATCREELVNKCRDYIKEIKDDKFMVYQCSFSMNGDNLPLWNYYTKNNEMHGVCIGFDSKELASSINENISRAKDVGKKQLFVLGGPVIYDTEEQVNIIKEYIEEYEKIIFENIPDNCNPISKAKHFFGVVLSRIALAGTFFKMKCFSPEEEYRLAVYLLNEDGNFVAFEKKQVKYVSRYDFYLPCTDLSIDLSCIKSIVLSPTYNFENMSSNMRDMLRRYNIDNDEVEIIQSQIPVRY